MSTGVRKPRLVILGLLLAAVAALASASTSPAAAGDELLRIREIVELRDATSKTYELADGKREWVGYPEAVHYRDSNGNYQEVDNSIVAESAQVDGVHYAYRNGANEYIARFAAKADEAGLVRIEYRGRAMSFGPTEARASAVANTADVASRILSEMTYGQSLVTYPEIYPGVDLLYETKSHGVKEYLFLKESTDQNEFTFDLELSGLIPKDVAGRISFRDEQGEEVFWVGGLFAVDDAGVSTQEVSCTLVENAGACQLKLIVDKDYLKAAERVYPVVIDPSVMISSSQTADSFVSSRYPTANYYLSSYLRTGYYTDYGTRRTYIKFNLSGATGFWPEEITAAYIRMEKYGGGGTPQVAAYRVTGSWSSSTITWNNKPGYSTSSDDHSSYAWNDSGSWWRMDDCEAMVKNWLSGTYSNYGFCIKDHYEDGSRWTNFYSSDASSPHKPELHIVYTSWTYCYDQYDGAGGWRHSQSTTDSAKNWTGTCYYRFHSSMSSTFRDAVYAAVDTWSAQDSGFYFCELPMGSDPEDHGLSMAAMDPQLVAVVQGASVWFGGGQADVGRWHMHFNTAITWCNGAFSNQHDRQGIATHEFGHCVKLMDLPGSWSDGSASKPTMASWGANTTGHRSLASGDITGITQLY